MNIRASRTSIFLRCFAVIIVLLAVGTITYTQQQQKSLDEIRQLAEQGDAEAQNILGIRYFKGEGVKKDEIEAAKWFQLAAEQDHSDAQTVLGLMYTNGEGVPQVYMEAEKWFRLAADQGNPHAQNFLGSMFLEGKGVPQDYIEAHKWFNLAASRSEGEARDMAVNNRDAAAKKMTPAQIAEAQRLAREWNETHGE